MSTTEIVFQNNQGARGDKVILDLRSAKSPRRLYRGYMQQVEAIRRRDTYRTRWAIEMAKLARTLIEEWAVDLPAHGDPWAARYAEVHPDYGWTVEIRQGQQR